MVTWDWMPVIDCEDRADHSFVNKNFVQLRLPSYFINIACLIWNEAGSKVDTEAEVPGRRG
jgi:hypothetical protein